MTDNNMVRLTGLWKNKTKTGESFLAGSNSPSSRLIILPNTKKASDKEPDYTAFIAPNIKKEGSSREAREDYPF